MLSTFCITMYSHESRMHLKYEGQFPLLPVLTQPHLQDSACDKTVGVQL